MSSVKDDIEGIENWAGIFSYKPTIVLKWLLASPCKITCLFTGNQFGKNETAAVDQTFSILGTHPNVNKRIKPEDEVRTLRFASQTLPGEKEEEEVKNTQYPAFKRRFPKHMIEKEITSRKPTLTTKTPDGGNAQIEFVSFSQDVQSGAGVQRKRIWIDEECSRDFYEEQIPRLLAADGDIVFTFTPVPGAIGWEFDELYERAKIIYRTPAVRARVKERYGEDYPECQITDSKDDICVIMAATDDNPIYEEIAKKRSEQTGISITAKQYIDSMFDMYDDEDVIDARRYGLFRQLSGKIYKSFCATQIIKPETYFPNGIPSEWKHYRGIDYHQSNPWACVWLSLSPQDEIFVWEDYAPSPQRMITYDIAENIASRSHDYRYVFNMIDPNASNRQPNTNLTTIDDLNRYFVEFRGREICTGGHWQAWDTHGGRGREELTKRLINSVKVGKPFNNKVVMEGRAVFLPTIWITQNCKNTIESMKNWRLEQWSSRESLAKNDPREKSQMRWSHFPLTLECMLKSPLLSLAKWGNLDGTPLRPKQYASNRG
uniref:Putative terminase n=1 Tax=viral metagenome TaxID=1070528 RepID=A0A6M3J734_9ZZZZ